MDNSVLLQVKQKYGIAGNSDGLNHALDIALQVAPTDLPVLIIGESGVGKEAIPRLIHDNSIRKHNRYMAINCGSVPEGLIDDELFGHVKGAFTGASEDRDGYFASVDGGTLFLDEVGELPPATQVRLLRILETGEYLRLGSSEVRKTNVRVVAATNVDMRKAIVEGRFREDLYYRLNTILVQMPPLRERGTDILLLFRKFALEMSEKYKMPRIELTEDASQMMLRYPWPGNIRELRNITHRICILEQDRTITGDIMQKYITLSEKEAMPVVVKHKSSANTDESPLADQVKILAQVVVNLREELNKLKDEMSHKGMDGVQPHIAQGTTVVTPSTHQTHFVESADNEFESHTSISISHQPQKVDVVQPEIHARAEVIEEPLSLSDLEREQIRKALQRNNGRRRAAAIELQISERTLYRKIKDYGLE